MFIDIINLLRAKSKADREENLLLALEDLKSGLITTPMYGSGKNVFIPFPHIIVSSNYFINYDFLSADQWETFIINHKKELLRIKIKRRQEITKK